MILRRTFLSGLAVSTVPLVAGCSQPLTPSRPPPSVTSVPNPAPVNTGLDAIIDLNHSSTVTDFVQARTRSGILAAIHKVSEGATWVDPLYKSRRAQALAAGLLWGGYHFGTRQYTGAQQANAFLAWAQPDPATLMALDLEPNERAPDNTMTVAQAEEFVATILRATGRLPMIYTHPKWANGAPYGRTGITLGQSIGPQSILASCDLWLADYRPTPEVPQAWTRRGWRIWQYAGDNAKGGGGALGYMSQTVAGIGRCDRNLFNGDASGLYQYWQSRAGV